MASGIPKIRCNMLRNGQNRCKKSCMKCCQKYNLCFTFCKIQVKNSSASLYGFDDRICKIIIERLWNKNLPVLVNIRCSYAFLVNELDSGQFGVVWLAEAVGISAFRPRDMMKEREGGGRFSFLWKKVKGNKHLRGREVTNVAVKCIKG